MTMLGWDCSPGDRGNASEIDELKAMGCKKVHMPDCNSVQAINTGLDRLIGIAKENDIVVTTKLGNFHTSMTHGMRYLETLQKKGVRFISVDDDIDTTKKHGFMTSLRILLEWHRFNRAGAIKKGQDKHARIRGTKGGRPEKLNAEQKNALIKEYNTPHLTIQGICKKFGIERRTLNRIIKRWKASIA